MIHTHLFIYLYIYRYIHISLMAQQVKYPPAMQETQETRIGSLGQEDPPEKEMAPQSSILS